MKRNGYSGIFCAIILTACGPIDGLTTGKTTTDSDPSTSTTGTASTGTTADSESVTGEPGTTTQDVTSEPGTSTGSTSTDGTTTTGEPDTTTGGPTHEFGPCDEFGQCADDEFCLTVSDEDGIGWICAPTCEWPECLVPSCETDEDCGAGLECFGETCAWPIPGDECVDGAPGHYFGECLEGGLCGEGECVDGMCTPSCSECENGILNCFGTVWPYTCDHNDLCHPADPLPSCFGEGGIFGPCLNDGIGDIFDNCNEGLACFNTLSGHTCLPIIGKGLIDDAQQCVDALGGNMACNEGLEVCFITCDHPPDDVCSGDLVCDDQALICVVPN